MQISFNYIQACLDITKHQAEIVSHSGDCTNDVHDLMELPEIKEQLSKIDKEQLKRELWEYGAWDDTELENHNENLIRIL